MAEDFRERYPLFPYTPNIEVIIRLFTDYAIGDRKKFAARLEQEGNRNLLELLSKTYDALTKKVGEWDEGNIIRQDEISPPSIFHASTGMGYAILSEYVGRPFIVSEGAFTRAAETGAEKPFSTSRFPRNFLSPASDNVKFCLLVVYDILHAQMELDGYPEIPTPP